jgi:hypothetical protein
MEIKISIGFSWLMKRGEDEVFDFASRKVEQFLHEQALS